MVYIDTENIAHLTKTGTTCWFNMELVEFCYLMSLRYHSRFDKESKLLIVEMQHIKYLRDLLEKRWPRRVEKAESVAQSALRFTYQKLKKDYSQKTYHGRWFMETRAILFPVNNGLHYAFYIFCNVGGLLDKEKGNPCIAAIDHVELK